CRWHRASPSIERGAAGSRRMAMRLAAESRMGGLQQRCLWEVVTPRLSGAASLNGEQRADVCVIGAGFTGLSAALHLLEAGRSVCVLEAYEVGHGGSGRNVGLINAGTWIPRTRWSPPSAPSREKSSTPCWGGRRRW
ncbi:NAD(P)/FAD-dependent oxidoreductase, partial [Serratia marcescens]|uniref:NAD(P)/FAD-dependent oxidoreductase n=1 Tax=Serratia marcescens TaxID=615 RepID=UPI0021B673FB